MIPPPKFASTSPVLRSNLNIGSTGLVSQFIGAHHQKHWHRSVRKPILDHPLDQYRHRPLNPILFLLGDLPNFG